MMSGFKEDNPAPFEGHGTEQYSDSSYKYHQIPSLPTNYSVKQSKKIKDKNTSHCLSCGKFQSYTSNLAQECIRQYLEFHDLSLRNANIRNKIRLQRKKAACECNKIIQAIINYCEDQLEYCYRCRCDPCCTIPSRLGAGCSTGGCGGYTPSGWNKLMSKARMLCDDKGCVCCAPTCTCADCLCIRRRPRCRPNLCKDFCNSQTSPQDECGNNNKNRPSLKLLGELAFQLERRILDYVFGMEDYKRRRFYGYTVSNIFSMMEKESKGPKGGSDVITKSELTGRLKKLLTALEKYGYNIKIHGEFAQEMVNKYGLLACPPDESTIDQFGLNDASSISCLIQTLAQGPSEISNFNILLNCLKYLSKCDKRPLFMW